MDNELPGDVLPGAADGVVAGAAVAAGAAGATEGTADIADRVEARVEDEEAADAKEGALASAAAGAEPGPDHPDTLTAGDLRAQLSQAAQPQDRQAAELAQLAQPEDLQKFPEPVVTTVAETTLLPDGTVIKHDVATPMDWMARERAAYAQRMLDFHNQVSALKTELRGIFSGGPVMTYDRFELALLRVINFTTGGLLDQPMTLPEPDPVQPAESAQYIGPAFDEQPEPHLENAAIAPGDHVSFGVGTTEGEQTEMLPKPETDPAHPEG